MDVVKSMRAFSEVAKHGSFAAAARSLGLSTTSVSRQVIELETWLGVTLIRRTTRKVSLTEEGNHYLVECQQVVEDVERILDTASDVVTRPTGTLRVTAPVFLAKECVQRILPGFLTAFPDVSVELSALDRFADLVEEGFDVALRVGDLPDSSLIARGLADVRLVIVGSPDYMTSRKTPATPSDLKEHNCIVDKVAKFGSRWPMMNAGKRQNISVSGNITVNNGEIARELAIQNVGLAILPKFFVVNQLENGELVEVLRGKVDGQTRFHAIYPQSRHLSPKVRAFIDYVVEYFDRRGSSLGTEAKREI